MGCCRGLRGEGARELALGSTSAQMWAYTRARVWSCGGMESVAGFDVGPAVVQLWVSEPGYLSGLLQGVQR